MTTRFRLTPRAVADLDAIADYTIETWGISQLEHYLGALFERFAWLAQNPLSGRDRDDVHPGYRSFPEGRHVIFYVVSEGEVHIIGIPHESMDIAPELFGL